MNETVWRKVVERRNFQRKMERRQTGREYKGCVPFPVALCRKELDCRKNNRPFTLCTEEKTVTFLRNYPGRDAQGAARYWSASSIWISTRS